MLRKEEKQVRRREVVVRHGGGDKGLPVGRLCAPQDPAYESCKLLAELPARPHKIKGVKGFEEFFWGVRHGRKTS